MCVKRIEQGEAPSLMEQVGGGGGLESYRWRMQTIPEMALAHGRGDGAGRAQRARTGANAWRIKREVESWRREGKLTGESGKGRLNSVRNLGRRTR